MKKTSIVFHEVPDYMMHLEQTSLMLCTKSMKKMNPIPRKTIGAQELFFDPLKERAETGRIYIMNMDHANSHSSFKDKVSMSNLCQEITLPTTPIQGIDDDKGEIALCILSAINVGQLNNPDSLENLCDLAVRSLMKLLTNQDYPVKAAEVSTKARRSYWVLDTLAWHIILQNKDTNIQTKVLGNQ